MRSFLAGAFSGTCSTVLLQPLDLIKTRLQQSPGSTILNEVHYVLQTDGARGFWTGVTPSLWRTVPGIGFYFSSIHTISGLLVSDGKKMTSTQSLFVGSNLCLKTGMFLDFILQIVNQCFLLPHQAEKLPKYQIP